MNDLEKRTLDMFRRVRDFDAAHDGLFPTGALGRELFDIVGSVINDLEDHATAESGGRGAARQSTISKAAARGAIVEDLGILRRTARTMNSVESGIEEKFRVPHRQDGEDLLITARVALAAAEPLKAEFLRREVQEQVFQDLANNIDAYATALSERNTAKEEAITAAASIDAAMERGTDALRQLDPIIRNKFHNNTAILAAWLSAKRTERAPRRNNASTPPAPQTPNT